MLLYVTISLFVICAIGWNNSHRRLSKEMADRSREKNREMTEILPETADRAWLTMYSTLFSISLYPPFIDETKDHYWGPQFTTIGEEYRNALHQGQKRWFQKSGEPDIAPLEFAKAALSAHDDVLLRFGREINEAHSAMMRRYENEAMPVRNQDGFNWVRLW